VRELVVETEGSKLFTSTGWRVYKVVFPGVRGAPDRWMLKSGIWALVEYKKFGEKPDAQQQKRHNELRGQGQRVWVIDNIPAIYALHAKLEAEIAARAR
jgi:hypothetical protein